MSIKKTWQCEECMSNITVTIKSKEFNSVSDVRVCPVCAAPVPFEDDELEED